MRQYKVAASKMTGYGVLASVSLPPCGGGMGWGGVPERGPDGIDHSVEVAEYIGVPEPKHPESLAFEPSSAAVVAISALGMLSAVHLDSQPRLVADEIRNVGSEGYLPAEAAAMQLAAPQARPQPGPGVGGILAEGAGLADGHGLIIGDRAPPPQPSPARGEGDLGADQVAGHSTHNA